MNLIASLIGAPEICGVMRMRKSALLALVTLFSLQASAAPWDGLLSPERAIDWSKAGAGTVPERAQQCGATIAAGASASTINSAIQNCPAGQHVKLAAGTFNVSAISFGGKNDVTLRGSGPDQTFLRISGTTGCTYGALVCLTGPSNFSPLSPQNTANWTGTNAQSGVYTKGATQISLSSVANLSVGSIIVLHQNDDTSDQWPEVFQCATAGTCSTESTSYAPLLNQNQVVRVTSVPTAGCSPCEVGISPGIYMPNWRTGKNPRAYWQSSYSVGQGLEDLSVENLTGTGTNSNIAFSNVRNSWVKNVRSLNANRNHIGIYGSVNVTVRDSYTFGLQGSGNLSYGIEPAFSSAFLAENNIHHHHQAAMMLNQGASGGVWAYNYVIDSQFCISTQWMNPGGWHHAAGTDYILWEGNDLPGLIADAIHGTSHFTTMFRNRSNGYDPYGCSSGGKDTQTIPVHLYAFARYFNVLGNVLGDDRVPHSRYEGYPTATTGGSGTAWDTSIFMLGFSGNQTQSTSPSVPNDLRVRESLFRWGNWDTVSDAARWSASEVPTGLTKYSNAVPASQSLPSSLYLTAKPAWFGSIPFPAIGPEISSGRANTPATGAEGKFYKIPARVCFESVMNGKGTEATALAFNADRCYGTSSQTPMPPQDVIVQ